MEKQEYIYRVAFNEPPTKEEPLRKDYYFTSLSAIFERFTKEDIGCQLGRLWNIKITPEKPYIGRKCTITKEIVSRKRRNKKNNP